MPSFFCLENDDDFKAGRESGIIGRMKMPSHRVLKNIGVGVLIGTLAYVVYMSWGKAPNVLTRAFDQCPKGQQLFVSDTFGYSLCLPESWVGRYSTENKDKTISFIQDIPNNKNLIFSVTAFPAAYWDQMEAVRNGMQYLGRDDERVFAAKVSDYVPRQVAGYEEMWRQTPDILRTIAYSPYKSVDRTIEDYFSSQVAGKRTSQGKVFTGMEIMGRDQEGNNAKYYVWAHAEEYELKNGQLYRGATLNLPLVFTVQPQAVGYAVTGFQAPRGGKDFSGDVKKLFPERLAQSEWFSADLTYHNEHVAVLKEIIRSKARAEFKIMADKRFGYIRTVTAEEGQQKLSLDPATLYTGQQAQLAMRAAGKCGLNENCESKNGYFISNPDGSTEPYDVAVGAEVQLLNTDKMLYTDFLEKYLKNVDAYKEKAFNFEIEGGKIVSISEFQTN